MAISDSLMGVLQDAADKGEVFQLARRKFVIRMGGLAFTFSFVEEYCTRVEYREQDTVFAHVFSLATGDQEFFTSIENINGEEIKFLVITKRGKSRTLLSKRGITANS